MTIVALGSLKGSPGVTTTTLALAHVWPVGRDPVVVDADPAGGDLARWLRLDGTSGLLRLAAEGFGSDASRALRSQLRSVAGLDVLAGGVTAGASRNPLALVAAQLAEALCDLDRDVLIDCGRVYPGSPGAPLVAAADVVLVVLRPLADELTRTAEDGAALLGRAHDVLLIGRGSRRRGRYRPEPVRSLGLSVRGVIDDDPRAAARLRDGGSRRLLDRSGLVRTARAVVSGLLAPGEAADSEERLAAEVPA